MWLLGMVSFGLDSLVHAYCYSSSMLLLMIYDPFILQVHKLKIFSESLVNSTTKAEKRILDNRFEINCLSTSFACEVLHFSVIFHVSTSKR